MGLTAQVEGVGRFNVKKLNSCLYGLNKRLEDGNRALVERIAKLEAGVTSLVSSVPERFVNASRGRARVSTSPGGLGNIEEGGENGKNWSGEKAELEAVVGGLQEELEKLAKEKEEHEAKLNAERTLDNGGGIGWLKSRRASKI